MTDIIELYAENKAKKAAENAVKQERISMAKSLLKEGIGIEFVVRNSKLTEDEVRALAEKQSA